MSFSATTDWHLLANKYYRKTIVYDNPSWKLGPFSKLLFATSPSAGPIAILPDQTQLHTLSSTQSVRPTVKIYTQSGKLLSQFAVQNRLIAFAWVRGERLACVGQDGNVRVCNLHGEYKQFSMGSLAKEHGVIDCKIWESGRVIRG
jgi:hypothetical protein